MTNYDVKHKDELVKQVNNILYIINTMYGCSYHIVEDKQPVAKDYIWPTREKFRISGVFGEDRGDHKHSGIDIAAPMGHDVLAVRSGVVVFAHTVDGYGQRILIEHQGTRGQKVESTYNHLSKIIVKPGQVVKQGELIGNVGSTGRSTGPHLHFEIRDNGKFIDPLPVINQIIE